MSLRSTGLNGEQVIQSREKYGSNILSIEESETFLEKLAENFKDPIIVILCVAFVITTVLSFFHYTHWYEGFGIALAIVIATFVSTFSEFKSESSFRQLQEEASRIKINVFRDGNIVEIDIVDVVVGDHVLLQPGNKVPADGKVLQGELESDQAALTGESEPVRKIAMPAGQAVSDIADLAQPHVCFRGTVVLSGEAVMEVERVGSSTFYGKLAKELVSEQRKTPLQVKLSNFAGLISKIGYIGGFLIAVSFLARKIFVEHAADIPAYMSSSVFIGDAVHAFVLAVIIIVVAVPEGLPMMIAFILSINMRKLLKDKVLVRKLLGIETAGSLDLLFTDKTGTLTKGRLKVETFFTADLQSSSEINSVPEALKNLLIMSLTQNTSSILNSQDKNNLVVVGGNLTDKALMEFAGSHATQHFEVTITDRIQFNSALKFSAARLEGAHNITLIKGAAEVILSQCRHHYDELGHVKETKDFSHLHAEMERMTSRSMRLIAFATSEHQITDKGFIPHDPVLLGIVCIRDEIREEAKPAMRMARDAGIQVVMITGDKKETAKSIAEEIGLVDSPDNTLLTSLELNAMSDDDVRGILSSLRVVARAVPTDKSRLVRISQSMGRVVGMTGDGINDAPALNKADVGFSMGSGTEVAKEASDIVILDDNFKSIIKAVLFGRTIYKNIRKFISFQLSISFSAVLISFVAVFFGIRLPFTVLQLLWVNLIMDTLAGLALGNEPSLESYMKEKPIRRDSNILSREMVSFIAITPLILSSISIGFLTMPAIQCFFRSGDDVFVSAFFSFFVLLSVVNLFNARTPRLNLLNGMRKNPLFFQIVFVIIVIQVLLTFVGGKVMSTVPLIWGEWVAIALLACLILPLDLIRKTIISLINKKSV